MDPLPSPSFPEAPAKKPYFAPTGASSADQSSTLSTDVYTCSQCGKIYQYLHNLRKHQRMECGKEPQFACPHCPHRSYAKWNLNKHIQTRHQGTAQL